jgi:anti-anti-sigma factor
MEIDLSSDGDLLLITTRGGITADQLLVDPDPLTRAAGPHAYSCKILIDLSNSEFIDTSGISWLLTCHKRAREARGALVLHSIPPLVLHTLKILRLDKVFVVAEDLTGARRAALGEPTIAPDHPAIGEPA